MKERGRERVCVCAESWVVGALIPGIWCVCVRERERERKSENVCVLRAES